MDSVKGFLDRVFKFFDVVHLLNTKPHPTLKFHRRHGKSVEIDEINSIACRNLTDFQHGLVFSNRSLEYEEPVCLKILKRNRTWTGPLCFGFTTVNPALLRPEELERARILKTRYRGSFWFHGIYSDSCTFITFVMKRSGDVLFSIDGEEGYTIPRADIGLDPREELWAAIDVYGSFTAVQLAYHPMLNSLGAPKVMNDTASISSASGSDMSSVMDDSDEEYVSWSEVREVPPRPQRFNFDVEFIRSMNAQDERENQQNSGYRSGNITFSAIASPLPCDYKTPVPLSPLQNTCVICQVSYATHAFKDCGHLSLCYECSLNYVYGTDDTFAFCPVCRKRHSGVMRIY